MLINEKYKHRKRKQKNKIFIFSMVGVLLFMCIGYAAFQTQVNINAKGNVLKVLTASEKLTKNVASTGDGLYLDNAEEGRYIYKGSNPNNYITFNNETWRILSVESDETIKIIRNESIGNMTWDTTTTRDKTTSTYCVYASSNGCNAWAATTNLVGTPTEFTLYSPNGNPTTDTTKYSGTVITDSSLNTYLNGEYYNSLTTEAKSYIVNHNFNVGTPGNASDTEDIATDVAQEALYKWTGKIGLINITETLRATVNTACTSLNSGYGSPKVGNCNTNNWLWPTSTILGNESYEYTISPYISTSYSRIWHVYSGGYIDYFGYTTDSRAIRPTLYLDSSITLSGDGSIDSPYKITGSISKN